MGNAVVTAYGINDGSPAASFKGTTAIATGSTNASAAITGLALPFPLNPPYILEFTTDGDTIDLTTGLSPVIKTLRTVMTQAMLESGEQIYATPLTTMAVDLAIKNADKNVAPFTGNNDGNVSEAEFLAALPIAADQVTSTLGFGMSSSVDIFQTPPLVDSTTTSDAQQQAVAEYRAAVEAVTAVVFQMDQQSSDTTPDGIMGALAADLADGNIDGQTDGEANGLSTEARDVLDQDPSKLPIPNTDKTVADVAALLTTEQAQTRPTQTVVNTEAVVVNTTPAETNPDIDGDGVPNSQDAFPNDPNESVDTDHDGIGNNADTDDDNDGWLDAQDDYPLDATRHLNPALDRDGDTIANGVDNCPLTANTAQTDTDHNGVGDACSDDNDGDGVADGVDNCPLVANPDQTDTGGSAAGDACDPDIDGDGVANADDAFPYDASASVDTDGDGKPDSVTGETTLVVDTDDDNDGVLDVNEAEGCSLKRDCDGDGRLDLTDRFPLNPAEWKDSDGDCGDIDYNTTTSGNGCGNNSDTDDDNDGLSDADEATAGTKPLVADTDGDGLSDGDEVHDLGTNPLLKDTDGDTHNDNVDVFPTNAAEWADSDVGEGDVANPDGIGDNSDNCPTVYNPGQEDVNSNSVGDACDATPVPAAQSVSTGEDSPLAITLTATDAESDAITYTVVGMPEGGALTGTAPNLTYTPGASLNALALGDSAVDSFTFTAGDGASTSDPVTVTITINGANDAPAATAQSVETDEDSAVGITLTGTDIDGTVDGFTATAPAHGMLSGEAPNLTYTPTPNYNGSDSFTFTVTDNNSAESASATVSITINPQPDAPVANGDAASTDEDTAVIINLTGNDTDADGDSLSVSAVDTESAHGTIVNNNNGTVTYTPAANYHGGDSFGYTVSDGNGGTDTATVTVTVNSVNDAPVANDDAASAKTNATIVVDVLANDTDVDNDDLSVVSVGTASSGTASLDGANVMYTAPATAGVYTFTYTVSDGGLSDTATVTVTVSANDPPTANANSGTMDEDGAPIDIALSGSDPDSGPDPLTFVVDTAPTKGTVEIVGSTATYTVNANANGADSFTYKAFDGVSYSDPATVSITINPQPDAPVAVNDGPIDALAGYPLVIDVLANDTDADGDSLGLYDFDATGSAGGTIALNETPVHTLTYTPAAGYTGQETFTYRAWDEGLASNSATVTFNVGTAPTISGIHEGMITSTGEEVLSLTGSGTCFNGVDTVGANPNFTQETKPMYLSLLVNGPSLTLFFPGGMAIGDYDAYTGDFTATSSDNWTDTQSGWSFTNTTTVMGNYDVDTQSLTASVTDMENGSGTGGSASCQSTHEVAGTFLYQTTGLEDYSGVYGLEIQSKGKRTQFGSPDVVTEENDRDSLPIHFDIIADSMQVGVDGPDTVVSDVVFFPTSGAFSFTLTNTNLEDHNGDQVPDFQGVDTTDVSGLFIRAPDDTSGPTVAISFEDHGSTVDLGTSNVVSASDSEGLGYGKRLVTQGYTRSNLNPNGSDSVQAIFMGVLNPPLVRNDTASALVLQVLDGSTELCSATYFDPDNRYNEMAYLPPVNMDAQEFQGANYSYVSCNTSLADGTANVMNNGGYTVQIIDTGADGVVGGTDDMVVWDNSGSLVTAKVATDFFTTRPDRRSISLNGAMSSQTLEVNGADSSVIELHGYFNPALALPMGWTPVDGAADYEVQIRESKTATRELRVASASAGATIPAGTLDRNGNDHVVLRLNARATEAGGVRKQAFSRWLEVMPGLRGLFNIELGASIDMPYLMIQVGLYAEAGDPVGTFECFVTNNPSVTCGGGSLNFVNNTVTLNMTDVQGGLVGTANGTFDLKLQFDDSANATVSSPTLSQINTVSSAKLVNTEMRMRTFVFENGAQTTQVVMANPLPFYGKSVFKQTDDGAITFDTGAYVDGVGNLTGQWLWDSTATNAPVLEDVLGTFIMLPTDDLVPQGTGSFVSNRTYNDWGWNSGVLNKRLSASNYKIVLDNHIDGGDKWVFKYDYASPDASALQPPSLNGDITLHLSGGADVMTATGNDSAATPVGLTGSVEGLTWTPQGTPPAGTQWQVVITKVDPVNGNLQVRTPWMTDADAQLTDNGDGSLSYNFLLTELGALNLDPGELFTVQIRSSNPEQTMWGLSKAFYIAPATQNVTTASPVIAAMPGQAVSLSGIYTTSDNNNKLSGLGIRVHYDSTKLTFVDIDPFYSINQQGLQCGIDDTEDYDNDTATDKRCLLTWADTSGQWPYYNFMGTIYGDLPLDLFTINFTASGDLTSTTVNFTRASTAAGYSLYAPSVEVSAVPQ